MSDPLFDSVEYWQTHLWDRDREHARAALPIQAVFEQQEKLTICAAADFAARQPEQVHVLDLPVGTGRIARMLCDALPGATLTIGDINRSTLEIASSRLSSTGLVAEAVCIDAYDVGTSFPNTFNIVVCLDFLSHVADLPRFVQAVADSLKPGGLFIANSLAAEWFAEYELTKYGWWKAARRSALRRFAKGLYPHAPDTLRYVIRRMGLARIEGVSKQRIQEVLQPAFDRTDVVSTFYHWFAAHRKPGPYH